MSASSHSKSAKVVDALQSNFISTSNLQSSLPFVSSLHSPSIYASHVFLLSSSYEAFQHKDRINWMYRGLFSLLRLEDKDDKNVIRPKNANQSLIAKNSDISNNIQGFEHIGMNKNEKNGSYENIEEMSERCESSNDKEESIINKVSVVSVLNSPTAFKKLMILDQKILTMFSSSPDGSTQTSISHSDVGNDTTNKNRCLLSPLSQIYTLYTRYNVLFTVDISPSMSVMDPSNGEVVFDRVYVCLEEMIRDLSKKCQIPAYYSYNPEVYISVIAVGSVYRPVLSVIQNLKLTEDNVDVVLDIVRNSLQHIENVAASAYLEWNGHRKGISSWYKSDFNTVIEDSLMAFDFMTKDACPSLVIITDNVYTLSNLKYESISKISSTDTNLTIVNVSNLECAEQNFCYIPNVDFMDFYVRSTRGTLINYKFFQQIPDEISATQSTLLPSTNSSANIHKDSLEERRSRYIHEAIFFKYASFSSNVFHDDTCNTLLTSRSEPTKDGLSSEVCIEYKLRTSRLDSLLKLRLTQGFHVDYIDFHKKRVETSNEFAKPVKIHLHFQFRPNIHLEYIVKTVQDIDSPRSTESKSTDNRVLNIEVRLHSPATFIEQYKKFSKRAKRPSEFTIKSILEIITRITSEDKDLERLHALSEQEISYTFKRILPTSLSDNQNADYNHTLFDHEVISFSISNYDSITPVPITSENEEYHGDGRFIRSPSRNSFQFKSYKSEESQKVISQIEKILGKMANGKTKDGLYIAAIPRVEDDLYCNFLSIKRDNDRGHDIGFCIFDVNWKTSSISLRFFDVSGEQRVAMIARMENSLSQVPNLTLEKKFIANLFSCLPFEPLDVTAYQSLIFQKIPHLLSYMNHKKWIWPLSENIYCNNSVFTLLIAKRLKEGFNVIQKTQKSATFWKKVQIYSNESIQYCSLFYGIHFIEDSKLIITEVFLEPLTGLRNVVKKGSWEIDEGSILIDPKAIVRNRINNIRGAGNATLSALSSYLKKDEDEIITNDLLTCDLDKLVEGKTFQLRWRIVVIFIYSWIYHYGNKIEDIPINKLKFLLRKMTNSEIVDPTSDISCFVGCGDYMRSELKAKVNDTSIFSIANIKCIEEFNHAILLAKFYCKLYYTMDNISLRSIIEDHFYSTDSDIISVFYTFDSLLSCCHNSSIMQSSQSNYQQLKDFMQVPYNIQGLWRRSNKRAIEFPLLDTQEDNDQLLKRLHNIIRHANMVEVSLRDVDWVDEHKKEENHVEPVFIDIPSTSEKYSSELEKIELSDTESTLSAFTEYSSQSWTAPPKMASLPPTTFYRSALCFAKLVGESSKLLLTFVPTNVQSKSTIMQIVVCECSPNQLFDIKKVKTLNDPIVLLENIPSIPSIILEAESDNDSITHYQHFLEEVHSHSFTFGLYKKFQKQSLQPIDQLKTSIESCVEYGVEIDLSDLIESIMASHDYFYKSVAEYESPYDEMSKYFEYLIKKHFLLPEGSDYHFVLRERADKNASTILSSSNLFLNEFEDVGEEANQREVEDQSPSIDRSEIIIGKSEFFSDTSSNSFNLNENLCTIPINLPAYFRMECKVSASSQLTSSPHPLPIYGLNETYHYFPTSGMPIEKIHALLSGGEESDSKERWFLHHIGATGRKSILRLILITFPPDKFMLGDNNCEPQDPEIIRDILNSHERNRFSYCSSQYNFSRNEIQQEDDSGDLDISYLPPNLRKLMIRTKKKIQALVSKEVINCLLHTSPLSVYILEKVKYHLRNMPPQCYGTTPYDLRFVDQIQGPTLFESELRKYKHSKIKIVKLGDDYVIKMKRSPNKRPSYYAWHDQYLNDEDYANNREFQKIKHSSSFPDLLGGDDLIMSPDGFSSEEIFSSREGKYTDTIYEEEDYVEETPYWLIISVSAKRCTVLFYSPFPITPSQRNLLNNSVRDVITEVNKRVNTLILLNDLHDTRYCSSLLLPPSEVDMKMELDVSHYDQENLGEFEPGEFECQIVHQLSVDLHSRLNPEISMIQLGETVFFSFEVLNRKNVYVCRERNGRVFYIRLAEYVDDHDHDTLIVQNKSLSLSHIGNMLSFQKISEGETKKQSKLMIKVYGVDPPSTTITEHLMDSVKSKLSAVNLGILSDLLSKNRRFKLTLSDLEYLRPLDSPGDLIATIPIPSFIKHKYIFLLFLRQNMNYLNQLRLEVSEQDSIQEDNNQDDKICVDFKPLNFSFIYNFKTFERMNSEVSIGQGISCIHLTPLNEKKEILYHFEIQQQNISASLDTEWIDPIPQTFFVNWDDPSSHPLPICHKDNSESSSKLQLLFEIWTKGEVNADALLDRLSLSINHTLLDFQLEFGLFTRPLNDTGIVSFLETYSTLTQRALEMQFPSVNTITLHVFLPHWNVSEFVEHLFAIIKDFEGSLNPQLYKLSPTEDITSPLYAIVGGEFGEKSIEKKQSIQESHIAFHSFIQIPGKNYQLIRNCIIVVTISTSSLSISTFNMKRSRFEELQDRIQRYTSFTKCRQLLLSSILHQKLGLYYHTEQNNLSSLLDIQEQNTTKQKLDFNLRFSDIDALLFNSRVSRSKSTSRTSRKKSLETVLPDGLNVNKPFNLLLKGITANDTNLDITSTSDPLRFHGTQFKEIIAKNLQETVEKSRISHIYNAWEKGSHVPSNPLSRLTFNELNTIKKTSRLFHFCRSPLFFNELRQIVFDPAVLDRFDYTRITNEKYVDAQTRREVALHIQLQRSFLDEYSQYLRDFMEIRESLVVSEDSSTLQLIDGRGVNTDKVILYFQKIIFGGVILLELSFENVYCSLNLYVSDLYDRRNQMKNQRQSRLQFLQYLGHIKHELHVNSFLYDYQLRKFYQYIARPDSEQFPNLNIVNILKDFEAFHKSQPAYSRNMLINIQNYINVQLPQYASTKHLLSFIQEQSKNFGSKGYRRLSNAIVIPQSNSIVTDYKFVIVVTLSDAIRLPTRSKLVLSENVSLQQKLHIICLKDENLCEPASIQDEKDEITRLVPFLQSYAENYMDHLLQDILIRFRLETLWKQAFEKRAFSHYFLQLFEICKRTDAMDYFDSSLNALNNSGKDIPWQAIFIEYVHRNQSSFILETEHINHLVVFNKHCPNILLDVESHIQENEISIYICERRLSITTKESKQHPDIQTRNHLDETQFLLEEDEINESNPRNILPSAEVCSLVDEFVNEICAITWELIVRGVTTNYS